MIDQEINWKIAELCGWKRGKRIDSSFSDPNKTIKHDSWINPRGFPERKIPDYCSDLNAMHEVEVYFHSHYDEQKQYIRHLELVCLEEKHSGESSEFATLNATALQRAEAFLRTKGEWKE